MNKSPTKHKRTLANNVLKEKLCKISLESEEVKVSIGEQSVGDPLQQVARSCNKMTAPLPAELFPESSCESEDSSASEATLIYSDNESESDNNSDFILEQTEDTPAAGSTAILQPHVKGPAHNASNALEAWYLLLDEPIIEHIVSCINTVFKKFPKKRLTNPIEFRAWLGLNYLCGIFHNSANCGSLQELWTLEMGNVVYRSTMTAKRFELIATCVESDANIAEWVWEKFIVNCRSYYRPGDKCVVDEHILNTNDGTCPYKNCLTKAPAEKGARFITLCDATTKYLCNAHLAEEDDPTPEEMMFLLRDVKNSHRLLVISERYGWQPFRVGLLKKKFSFVGPITLEDAHVPDEWQDGRREILHQGPLTFEIGVDKEVSESRFLQYVDIPEEDNPSALYLTHKDACQQYCQLAATYSTNYAAKSTWNLYFLRTILDYAAVNAWVLLRHSKNGDVAITQRDFTRQLGLYLTKDELKRRQSLTSKLTLVQRLQICEMLGESVEELLRDAAATLKVNTSAGTIASELAQVPNDIALLPKLIDRRLRCRKCPNGNKTRLRCQQCLQPLCNKHLIARCANCTGLKPPVSETETRSKRSAAK